MQINIDRQLAPLHELVFTEDKAVGSTVLMDKRKYRKYVNLAKKYKKMQEEMKEMLAKARS